MSETPLDGFVRSTSHLSQLERTAYHEAGHAVIALSEGCSLRLVTIVPTEVLFGRCTYAGWPRQCRPDIVIGPRTERRLRSAIVSGLAGHLAEKRFAGRHNWVGSRYDRDQATHLASFLVGSGNELTAFWRWMWVQTEALVNQPLNVVRIEAVAQALLREKTLQASQVQEIAKEALAAHYGVMGENSIPGSTRLYAAS